MMEIASEIGDPGLARLVHPVESITMSTTDGADFESIYLTMLFEEQRLEDVVSFLLSMAITCPSFQSIKTALLLSELKDLGFR